jgi:dienelactone hydrolase
MKIIFTSLLLTTWLLSSCQTQGQPSDFKKMEWLIGTWKGQVNGHPFYENWTKTSETTFENINFSICNGDSVVGGRSKIEVRNNKIAYTSDNLIWELKDLTDNQVIFENSRLGQTFTFTKKENGDWNANLKYPSSRIEYTLSKTKSIKELFSVPFHPIDAKYSGYLEYNGKKLFTSINFINQNGNQAATASTPDNLQLNQPFNSICVDPPFVKLTIQDGTKILELNTKIENGVLTGKMTGEIPATIHLEKKSGLKDSPKNYKIESVAIINGNTKLPGNLYIPKSSKPTGAIVMVCGSGKHIKEEYNGWADLFASKGVAVLIYDKRNVIDFPNLNIRQKSSDIVLPGELESDVQTAFELLKTRKEINPKKIGLLGFSQGAVVVPVVAANNPEIAFIVAVSGNTTTDKTFIIDQALNKLKARNISSDNIAKAEELLNLLFQYVKDRKNGAELQKQLDNAYRAGYGQNALPRYLPNDDEIKYLSTWNSFEHDPTKYWSKLSIPCYVVYGEKDVLIPVEKSVTILKDIFSGKQSLLTLKVYAGADHFIKSMPDRNNFDFPKFSSGYIEDLTNWVIQCTKQ